MSDWRPLPTLITKGVAAGNMGFCIFRVRSRETLSMALLRRDPHPLLTASPCHAAAGRSYQVSHTALKAIVATIALRVFGAMATLYYLATARIYASMTGFLRHDKARRKNLLWDGFRRTASVILPTGAHGIIPPRRSRLAGRTAGRKVLHVRYCQGTVESAGRTIS